MGGWLIEPDQRVPQFGDSNLIKPGRAFRRRAANDRGMLALMKSGIAVVKSRGASFDARRLPQRHSQARSTSSASISSTAGTGS